MHIIELIALKSMPEPVLLIERIFDFFFTGLRLDCLDLPLPGLACDASDDFRYIDLN